MQVNHQRFRDYLLGRLGIEPKGAAKRLAKKLGVTESSISHWRTGRGRPHADKVAAIAKYFGDDPVVVLQMAGHNAIAEQLKQQKAEMVEDNAGIYKIEEADTGKTFGRHLVVPILGRIRTSSEGIVVDMRPISKNGVPAETGHSEFVRVPEAVGAGVYGLKLLGQYLGPLIPEGAVLICVPGLDPAPGALCNVRKKGGLTRIAILHKDGTRMVLSCPASNEIEFVRAEDLEWIHAVRWIKFP